MCENCKNITPGYCNKCHPEYYNNILNSTKTWQEEFAEIIKPFCYEKYGKIYFGKQGEELRAEGVLTTIEQFISDLIAQTREETIREEIAYWIDVFDNRPKDRDLESDNIAQNFARIEIERLENKLK